MNTTTKVLACIGVTTIWAVTIYILEYIHAIPQGFGGWIWAFFSATSPLQVDWVNSPQKKQS